MRRFLAHRMSRSTRSARTPLTRRIGAAALVAAGFVVAIGPLPATAYDHQIVEIQNKGNRSLRADVIWAGTAPFTGLFLWTDNSSASQEFELLSSPDPTYFRIKARHSGQCLMLDWRSGSWNNGTPVIQYPFCDAGYAAAEWSISYVQVDNGYGFGPSYQILKNRATGRCLDAGNAAGGVPAQQAALQQWDCITNGNQWNSWNQMWGLIDPTHP
jgi:hypothetical protein